MQIIDNQEKFNSICTKLADEPIIYMDTEFYRRKTYYAQLSVVQIASKRERLVIDILKIDNLEPLGVLLANDSILKVFHAAKQDFEIFFHIFGALPKNTFDTQLAACVAGMGGIIGYGRLCKMLLNINLDKTMQTANWLDRPLSKELLEYAIRDVEYLIPLHRELSSEITSRKLWDTYHVRSEKLLNPNSYKPQAEKILSKMNTRAYSDFFRERLLHFVFLREECAQYIDVPRGFCISDRDLITLCKYLPTNNKDFVKIHFDEKPLIKDQFKTKLFELCLGLKE